jgi:hypothetical protein
MHHKLCKIKANSQPKFGFFPTYQCFRVSISWYHTRTSVISTKTKLKGCYCSNSGIPTHNQTDMAYNCNVCSRSWFTRLGAKFEGLSGHSPCLNGSTCLRSICGTHVCANVSYTLLTPINMCRGPH